MNMDLFYWQVAPAHDQTGPFLHKKCRTSASSLILQHIVDTGNSLSIYKSLPQRFRVFSSELK